MSFSDQLTTVQGCCRRNHDTAAYYLYSIAACALQTIDGAPLVVLIVFTEPKSRGEVAPATAVRRQKQNKKSPLLSACERDPLPIVAGV